MIEIPIMIILVAALFAAAVLNLALQTGFRNTVMRIAVFCAVGVGVIYYGSGYAMALGLTPTSLFRALLATCRMFGGVNDIGSIAGSPLLANEFGTAVFWFGHFCAFYVTASAAIATLGERLLRRIRVTLLRRGPLLVIYGINAASVSYGKTMAGKKHRSVLFVDPDGNTSFESTIKAFGAVIEKNRHALEPDIKFLKQINMGPGSRQLELAALHIDGHKNLAYAEKLMETLYAAQVTPQQTSLIISGVGEQSGKLQAVESKGYGTVMAFHDYDLTARLILREFPPCDRIHFTDDGRAAENFRVVISGYGRMGRAMLSQLICNAQFAGSTFRADIFDPGPQNGFLHEHELMKHYDIRFHAVNAKSDEFFSFLQENHETIRCIVLCTGDMAENREIAEDLAGWYRFGRRMPLIIQAAKGRYFCIDEKKNMSECPDIYAGYMTDIGRIDAMAMQINQMYCKGNGKTAEENWEACSFFDRMSSRASADFYPAMLRGAHKTKEEVLSGDWPPAPEVVENLAIAEHKRWCAFHTVMGFTPMPESVYEERSKLYAEEAAKTGSSKIRIGKDLQARQHACLIPWEQLDELSERENAVTGGSVNYKQMDRNNVLAVAQVLEAMKE